MDYRIADFILRTEGPHCDLVSCGLTGFKPFEIEENSSVTPTMLLRMDCNLDKEEYPAMKVLYTSTFEQNYATSELVRYATGYRFVMNRNGVDFILVKEDNSNVVESNLGCCEQADPSLVRFGIWMMFGIVIAPLGGIPIHSSVAVKDGGAVLCLGESGTGKSTHTQIGRAHV